MSRCNPKTWQAMIVAAITAPLWIPLALLLCARDIAKEVAVAFGKAA